jgi:hypothetical protein
VTKLRQIADDNVHAVHEKHGWEFPPTESQLKPLDS